MFDSKSSAREGLHDCAIFRTCGSLRFYYSIDTHQTISCLLHLHIDTFARLQIQAGKPQVLFE